MASNDFLTNGSTTTLTLLYDTPREEQTRFGPYRAYRVQTPNGEEHTFFPPRSLYPELDRMGLRRGSQISVRAVRSCTRTTILRRDPAVGGAESRRGLGDARGCGLGAQRRGAVSRVAPGEGGLADASGSCNIGWL